jgi:hypothetical protein
MIIVMQLSRLVRARPGIVPQVREEVNRRGEK